MKVLGLDTSTLMTTCAVIDEGKLIGEFSLSQDMSHSEKLVPMIQDLLKSLDLKIKDIDLFAAGLGPGSFTGLRIGLATIKAFAHIGDKPLVGLSTLEALAYNLPYNRIVVPMIDARRERVYTGIYTWEGQELKCLLDPCILEINQLLESLKSYDDIVVNGDGSLVYGEDIRSALGKRVRFAMAGLNMPRASSFCELAILKYNKGQRDDYYTLAPDYLIETQAQRELNEREK